MDFKVISSERYMTQVDALPSHPEGHFVVLDDLYCGDFAVSAVALRGIKRRHVKALERGDTSAMDRYVITDPNDPGITRFVNCDPGVPDPIQPIRTSIYVKGVREYPQ